MQGAEPVLFRPISPRGPRPAFPANALAMGFYSRMYRFMDPGQALAVIARMFQSASAQSGKTSTLLFMTYSDYLGPLCFKLIGALTFPSRGQEAVCSRTLLKEPGALE